MKVNIEINFDEVNYDEIEEVEDLTLYDSMDGWITEGSWPIDEEEVTVELPEEWIDAEVLYELQDEIKQRVDEVIATVDDMYYYGEIGQRTKTEIMELLENVLHGKEDPEL